MKSNEPHPLIKDYNSVEEMNKDFIKLTEFLKKSTYVGMEFVRTKPIVTYDNKFDRSFMKINPLLEEEKHIVLYAMQDLFLIRVIDDPFIKDRYELVNSKYTLDGNYKFIGKVYSEYKDKTKVYKEIYEELRENNKKRRKTK